MDNKELYDRILKASEYINKQSRKSYANYIVCSPQVAETLSHLDLLKERQDKIRRILRRIKDKKYGRI